MRRSITNPRVVLAIILFCSVVYAYVDRPRLGVGFGGIAGTVQFHRADFNSTDSRSARFRSELEKRLKSDEFRRALLAKDLRQPPFFGEDARVVVRRLTPIGVGREEKPFADELTTEVLDAYQNRVLVFTLIEENQADITVMYLFPKSYRVLRSDNSWILWFQDKLPGMPDDAKLAAEAEAANEAVKNDIGSQVQLAIQDSAAASRQ